VAFYIANRPPGGPAATSYPGAKTSSVRRSVIAFARH
jgi:hypothetical protein